jgi:hypothetical protein
MKTQFAEAIKKPILWEFVPVFLTALDTIKIKISSAFANTLYYIHSNL